MQEGIQGLHSPLAGICYNSLVHSLENPYRINGKGQKKCSKMVPDTKREGKSSICGDMMTAYVYLRGHCHVNIEQLFGARRETKTRGYNCKLSRSIRRDVKKHFFSIRTVDSWSELREEEVNATTSEEKKRER